MPCEKPFTHVLRTRGTFPAYAFAEVLAIVLTAKGLGTFVAGAALVASLVGSSGLTDPGRSALLLAFGALVALGLTRQGSR